MKPKRSIKSLLLLPDVASREGGEIKSAVLKERESSASKAEWGKSKLKLTLVLLKNGQSFFKENVIQVQVKWVLC